MSEATSEAEEIVENNDEQPPLKYKALIISPGMSANRRNYSKDLLESSMNLLDGRPIYIDHFESSGKAGGRSIKSRVGWWDNIEYGEMEINGELKEGILGTANYYRNSPEPWLVGRIEEAIKNNRPQDIGISIRADGAFRLKRDAQGVYKDILSINYKSADVVAEAGASGQITAIAEDSSGKDEDVETVENAKSLEEILEANSDLTIKELKEARPDLFEAKVEDKDKEEDKTKDKVEEEETIESKEDEDKVEDKTKVEEEVKESVEDKETYMEQIEERLVELDSLVKARHTELLESKMESAGLPEILRTKLREKFSKLKVITEDIIESMVTEYKEIFESNNSGPASASIHGYSYPVGNVRSGPATLDRVINSFSRALGATELSEGITEKDLMPVSSLREFYTMITGDRYVDGITNMRESVFGGEITAGTFLEAVPDNNTQYFAGVGSNFPAIGSNVSINAATGIFGVSMNRALMQIYKAQNLWWEPIVTPKPMNNMKVQTRVRPHEFGIMPTRAQSAEYATVAFGETIETYQPDEYGHMAGVSRLAIINDDLDAFSRIPREFARSAAATINNLIAGMFTTGSGLGPVMGDTDTVFHADHNNLANAALSRSSLTAAIKTMLKQTGDRGSASSQVIGFEPKFPLVPIDLIDVAYELLATQLVPDSANNARNFVASMGLENAIRVPNWTDENNWYLMASPQEVSSIEVGFLFDRREPEMIMQDQPSQGLVFTRDLMSWKQRWDVGAGWLDYRGAYGSIVS